MKRSDPRRLLPLLLLALAACRSSSPLPPPSVSAIAPARGFNGEELRVVISGEGFYLRPRQSLENDPTVVEGRFRAFLGEVELTGLERLDAAHLAATVPAGLAPGAYDLRVEGPYGSTTLGRAYAALSQRPANLSVQVLVPASVALGQNFELVVRASNASEGSARITLGAYTPGDEPGAVEFLGPPEPDGSAELGPQGSQDFVFACRATRLGTVTIVGMLGGHDVADGAALSVTASATLEVAGETTLVGLASASPAKVSVGQEFGATLQVANEGSLGAARVTPTLAPLGPGGAEIVAAPAGQDLAAPGSAVFLWSLRAARTGALTLRFGAAGTNALGPAAMNPVEVEVLILAPPALTGRLEAKPARVSVGQPVSLELTVTNGGEVDALGVLPAAPSFAGEGALAAAGEAPAAQDIPAGASRTFTWSFVAGQAGALSVEVGALGADALSGAAVALAPAAAPLAIDLARLDAALEAAPATLTVGQGLALRLTATNTGTAPLLAVRPVLTLPAGLERTTGPAPAEADLAPGASQLFEWALTGLAAGAAPVKASAVGVDANSAAAVESPEASAPVTILERAALSARLAAPAEAGLETGFEVALTVDNAGGSDASAVAPTPLLLSGLPATILEGPMPASAPVPAGGSASFRWRVQAQAQGSLLLSCRAAGVDATDGGPVASAAASATVPVNGPATLRATLAAPPLVAPGSSYSVLLTVANAGGRTASGVAPSAMVVSGTGTTSLLGGPAPAKADIAPGAQASFTWSFRAETAGMVRLRSDASGSDGLPITSNPAEATLTVGAAERLFADPFGDGTSFAHLFGYRGAIWLGPRKDGAGGVRFHPDGSGLEATAFQLPKDSTGPTTSANAKAAPFPSLGAAGCLADTAACGPDNEHGRGFYGAVSFLGAEWVLASGARSGANRLRYGYLSAAAGPVLDFAYLDLSAGLNGNTFSISAAHAFRDRLYLALPDGSPERPYLVALTRAPAGAGLDAALGSDLVELGGQSLPDLGFKKGNHAAPILIDAITDFNDRLYLFNNGGCARATVAVPGSAVNAPGDWKSCTPGGTTWTGKTSLTTTKLADLTPADRATPQVAAWRGRLFALRNTTTGPQLWACQPGLGGDADHCDPADWSLVAPNTSGDVRLTQFNNPANSAATLLVASADALYVGFDNPGGLVLLRTRAANPRTAADFEGLAGCSAAGHPATCAGLGGAGLGDPAAQRIFAAFAQPYRGRGYLYLASGDGSGPVRVFRVDDG